MTRPGVCLVVGSRWHSGNMNKDPSHTTTVDYWIPGNWTQSTLSPSLPISLYSIKIIKPSGLKLHTWWFHVYDFFIFSIWSKLIQRVNRWFIILRFMIHSRHNLKIRHRHIGNIFTRKKNSYLLIKIWIVLYSSPALMSLYNILRRLIIAGKHFTTLVKFWPYKDAGNDQLLGITPSHKCWGENAAGAVQRTSST